MAEAKLFGGLAVVLFLLSNSALSADEGTDAAKNSATGVDRVPPQLDAIKSYCSNIRKPAMDARHHRQYTELKGLSKQIDAKVQMLRERTEEYRKWYELRLKFAEKATVSLVEIYSKMRPEAAAAQISSMNQMTAAALLLKLDARKASAILNDIDPAKAAILAGIISAAARKSAAGDQT